MIKHKTLQITITAVWAPTLSSESQRNSYNCSKQVNFFDDRTEAIFIYLYLYNGLHQQDIIQHIYERQF